MRKFILLLVAIVAAAQLSAAPVDMATAQKKAQTFVSNNSEARKLMSSKAGDQFVLHRAVMGDVKLAEPVFYVFNSKNSFVIISGDDRAEVVLGYGEGNLDMDNIPDNMRVWLDGYKRQIEYLQERPGLQVQLLSEVMAPSLRAQSVPQLLTARWDQSQPFWNQCVFNGTQCLTGCPATSLAQVFYYWKYPTDPTPSISSYYCSSLGMTISALPSTTFDWANMRDYYGWSGGTGTAAQKAAVATLMRYIGQAEKMGYGPDGSGIPSSETSRISNACKTFGYDNNVRAIYKTNAWGQTLYNDTQWTTMIQNELVAGHPLVYCALSTQSGHAFNVDGYNATDNTYRINWGWSGSGNGYFAFNAFTIDGETFNDYQSMVIGIQPPGGMVTFPALTVEPTALTFTANTGTSSSQTFHVSGVNLLGDVTFTSNHGCFSVSPASLTAAQVEAGATVTVTYTPNAATTHTGKITIASSGAESKTVELTGTASSVPTLHANPDSLEFTTNVGEPVTLPFTLSGLNLTKLVQLSVPAGSGFSLDKTVVTKTAVTNGIDINVTFNPNAAGIYNAVVNITSQGADPITVVLKGTANVATYTPVMQPANAAYITSTGFRADWTDQTLASMVVNYTLEVSNQDGSTGDANFRLVENITDKFYTLDNLTAGATYDFRVMAHYADGSESLWSNTQEVTLLQGHAFELGDVNHDGAVSIADVTALIDYLLGSGSNICLTCADVTDDGEITIADVTALIDKLLSGN